MFFVYCSTINISNHVDMWPKYLDNSTKTGMIGIYVYMPQNRKL